MKEGEKKDRGRKKIVGEREKGYSGRDGERR